MIDHGPDLSLRAGLDRSELTYTELWVLYVGIGGSVSSTELAALIDDDDDPDTELGAYEHNLIAQALNEHFLDLGQHHPVAYREYVEDTGPAPA